MEKEQLLSHLKDHFGYLFEDALLERMAEVGHYRKLPHDAILMEVGQEMVGIPLILSGAVKIMRDDQEDHELLLYFLESGDTCAMSLSCCMASKKSKIRAITEGEVELVMIPAKLMNDWLGEFVTWRTYVFDAIRIRMDEFLEAVDSLAFLQLDERLVKYLRDRAKVVGSTDLQVTHQQIASDLNTSRVVVSRLLKRLENDGVLKIGRSHLEMLQM